MQTQKKQGFIQHSTSSASKEKLSAGFSMMEAIVVISVFSIIMVALVSITIYFYRVNAYSIEQAFAVNSARKGIEIMVEDIREATYSDEGAYPIIEVDAYSLTMYSDIDHDLNIERIRFFIEEDTFKRGTLKSSGDPLTYNPVNEVIGVVSTDVRNIDQTTSIFRYYDDTGGEILNYDLNITNIAFIKVNLIVNINPNKLPNEFMLQSSATLRNLKTNL